MPGPDHLRITSARIAEQVDYITAAFADPKYRDQADIRVVPSDEGVGFMYAEGQLLVRREHLDRVQQILRRKYDVNDRTEAVVRGVVLLHFREKNAGQSAAEPSAAEPAAAAEPPAAEPAAAAEPAQKVIRWRDDNRPHIVLTAIDDIDRELGEDIAAPNHVFTVAGSDGEVGPCPATEPEPVDYDIEPSPGLCWGNSGAGVLIYIADTGLLKNASADFPWLRGVGGDQDPLDPAVSGAPLIPPYAGHGTFVAGVARCMAPQADVFVSNIFRVAGSQLESHFVRELRTALTRGVDIFHLSVTAPTRRSRPPLAFEAWLNLLREYQGVVCVAAAGNNGLRLPCWPAAFTDVVSVGALAADRRDRANFSNYGGWVDVYAPGRNLINAYTTGTYKYEWPPYAGKEKQFYGMARWSGTSFSTPIVTGLIAARMSCTGENGKQAAAALLAQARCQAIPGVGGVLLPCDGNGGAQPPCPAECRARSVCEPCARPACEACVRPAWERC